MAKYSKGSQGKVKKAMHEMKRGELKSGRSGKTVKSREQAIAIGLSEARERGEKVPKKKGASKKSASKRGSKSSGGRKRRTASKSKGRSRRKSRA